MSSDGLAELLDTKLREHRDSVIWKDVEVKSIGFIDSAKGVSLNSEKSMCLSREKFQRNSSKLLAEKMQQTEKHCELHAIKRTIDVILSDYGKSFVTIARVWRRFSSRSIHRCPVQLNSSARCEGLNLECSPDQAKKDNFTS